MVRLEHSQVFSLCSDWLDLNTSIRCIRIAVSTAMVVALPFFFFLEGIAQHIMREHCAITQ